MNTAALPRLTSVGQELDLSPEAFGELHSSIDIVDDDEALRGRMREDGYLYLPGYLDRDEVLAARRDIAGQLAAEGLLDPAYPVEETVARRGVRGVRADIARGSQKLQTLLYSGRMIAFYERFLGGPVRHFDYTWLRTIGPGNGSAPHCDIVFMGRGTTNLYTAWTPLGDVSLEMGGVMILENSHRDEQMKATYGRQDVDAYCENRHGGAYTAPDGTRNRGTNGPLSSHPAGLRERMGGRWLTAEFRAGDLLTFSMFTVHASIDNHSDRFRLSCDTRYQLASEPVDERWIGPDPIAHGPNAARGMIC